MFDTSSSDPTHETQPMNGHRFMMSTELECLTVLLNGASDGHRVLHRFFRVLSGLAPTLPATSGIFNPYGRVYMDCGHVELAMCECSSPYDLASVVERQLLLVRQAVERLASEGTQLLLANNNHSGLLTAECNTWGSHENYLTEVHPSQFASRLLPFLVTRIYAGAGGVEYPTGRFLAAVRPLRMDGSIGGGTTCGRAIHSTAREEHHMGPTPHGFRYHNILGDGHRSHFNLALQFGATALAIQAAVHDPELAAELAMLDEWCGNVPWVDVLRHLNVLAAPNRPLAIEPLVIRTQRLYVAAAKRYLARLPDAPAWTARVLTDWSETLSAYERGDLAWLAARLDPFVKYQFYTAVLESMGKTWGNLPGNQELFHELALLDHSYHAFCDSRSVFERLESQGLLRHRVGPMVLPGQELEPFVPAVQTRADARARFIKYHADTQRYTLDWSAAFDSQRVVMHTLHDPFAQQFEPAASLPSEEFPLIGLEVLERLLSTSRRSG